MSGLPAKLDAFLAGCDPFMVMLAGLAVWLLGVESAPANVLDRMTSAADTFDRAVVRYNTAAGVRLYVRMRGEPAALDLAQMLMAELGCRGLGGERSVGKGAFRLVGEPMTSGDEPPSPTRRFVTLSPYHPTPQEAEAGVLAGASYQLLTRGGWSERSSRQRQRVRMLAEGSILPAALEGATAYGDVAEVTPAGSPHPVWRYGRAYPLWLP